VPHDNAFDEWIVAPWFRWDTQWYTVIAEEGYHRQFLTVFLPLYPLLIGLLGRLLFGEYLLAALIVSNVAALIALALLFELVRMHYTERLAHRVLWYFVLFPGSFFLIAAYTESLFLALVLGAFVAAERSRWGLAGLCGFLAIFTRWQGIALIPALVWISHAQGNRHVLSLAQNGRRVLYTLTPMPLAFFGVLTVFWLLGGPDALPWRRVDNNWDVTFTWPWIAWARTGIAVVGGLDVSGTPILTVITNWVITSPFYALLLASVRRLFAPHVLYAWGAHLMTTTRIMYGSILQSMPRYVLVLFPAFIMLALMGERRAWFNRLYVYLCAGFWLMCCAMFLLWRFIA
jgi:Gpi18-like mannosyltransferase